MNKITYKDLKKYISENRMERIDKILESRTRDICVLLENIYQPHNFNAVLTLLVLFALIKYIPPLLNWFIFDANFAGNTKEDCTGGGACWVFVKVWLNRFVYGM